MTSEFCFMVAFEEFLRDLGDFLTLAAFEGSLRDLGDFFGGSFFKLLDAGLGSKTEGDHC